MTMTPSPTIRVDLDDRSYDILISKGALAEITNTVSTLSSGGLCAIITDSNVNAAHGDTLRDCLDAGKIEHATIEIEAGEESKSWPVFQRVVDEVLGLRLERSDLIIAFGGGVVGDLAGFVAASVRRGMRFVQIPTSLLAQVDSSVGGKTGINSAHGKNLVGAFHQPSKVLIDLDVLKTLPQREFRAGYAEVMKYGLIKYPEFFGWLEKNHDDVFSHGAGLEHAIAQSCRAKADIVAADETEKGQRALLNLGHTFGHALEGYTHYDGSRLVHGEGVAIGMMLAHRFSNRMNLCSSDDVNRVETHLKAVGLPTEIQQIPGDLPSLEMLMNFVAQDKKVKRGALTFILTNGIGKAYIADDVPPSEVQSFLQDQLAK
ncbi:MAG: 3-dehydroquinate synthase [Pseudomonadota bacterium]